MPDLLAELHTAAAQAHPGADAERAHGLLATLYGCAVICLHRLGSVLTGQAAERAATTACASGDPLLAALAAAEVGLPLMHRGAYQPAARLTERSQTAIVEPTTPGSLTVRGYCTSGQRSWPPAAVKRRLPTSTSTRPPTTPGTSPRSPTSTTPRSVTPTS